MSAEQQSATAFILPHLFLQIVLSGMALAIAPFNGLALAVPVIIALLPVPAYFLPNVSNEAARIYLRSVGAALLCAMGIYAVGVAILLYILGGMSFTGW